MRFDYIKHAVDFVSKSIITGEKLIKRLSWITEVFWPYVKKIEKF